MFLTCEWRLLLLADGGGDEALGPCMAAAPAPPMTLCIVTGTRMD